MGQPRAKPVRGSGDLGIEAITGVIDGGGNRAWDNDNPLGSASTSIAAG